MTDTTGYVFIPPNVSQEDVANSSGHRVAPPAEPNLGDALFSDEVETPPPTVEERALVSLAAAAGEHERIARSRGWYWYDLDANTDEIPEEVRELLEPATARKFKAVPVDVKGTRVTVVLENPDDLPLISEIRPLLGDRTVRVAYANPAAIKRHLERFYSASAEAGRIGEESNKARSLAAVTSTTSLSAGGNVGRVEGGESANMAIMRLVIEQAIEDKASDIHIEPTEHRLEIRYRIDGKLRLIRDFPSSVGMGLMTYIKVQAKMKTDNFLIPDSGVMYYVPSTGKQVDIRVETAPTSWGTSAVMRLQAEIWRDLSTLGFSADNEKRFRKAIAQPYGIILATGPTGSGKSTTLYSAVREKIDPSIKITTLENPVEYKIGKGASQMSIADEQGMTFARGLRSILRQDPDVVLIGEIRDEETAETAVDAAMTGHLVFSTLHTNDAPGVVPRLIRMGIEPFMVSSSLLCVVAQRLVRRLCTECKIEKVPDPLWIQSLGFTPPEELPDLVFEANYDGCENCAGGFKGRVPIHEVMTISANLANVIADNRPFSEVLEAAKVAGMSSLREDGFIKALSGVTSITEVNDNTLQEF